MLVGIPTITVAEVITDFYASGDEQRARYIETLFEDLEKGGLRVADVTWEV